MKKTSVRTEPNKRDTLNRLLDVARQEFSKKGLSGARIEDIARGAGITKQLIYHYYGSKERLFSAVLDESSQRIMAELIALEVEHLAPTAALRALLNCCFDQYRDDPFLGALALEGIRYHDANDTPRNIFADRSPALAEKFDNILKRGAQCGEFKTVEDTRLFLATAALLTSGGFTNHYSVSVLIGVDTRSAQGMQLWRQYSADFIISSISLTPTPV
ncbi:TetR family transcriptional regulator [Marinobacterium aestuarii]|uniref:TetR family transcriptional regulator n=1 Tax=Marinobacterium aestuarii TaxID=1821621 RepID=A0A1A9F283_9GAMM|nr:TetR/AcrR family transcriptional regulator [Marinobacterium aestuarii]ANG64424.1 TetR family transcriptional regulator [Marinobacterium aestuarii]